MRENIFAELRETEYFLFIDFRRELLSGPPECIYRGSLFSHQELAIASYMDLDILPLQEDGVKKLDGMLGHIQANATKFNDRSQLPDLVRKKVAENGWRNDWRNQLTLEQSSPPSGVAHHRATNRISCFFHLTVRNHHSRVTARNCYAYLRRIAEVKTAEQVTFGVAELKWSGYTFPNASIFPGSQRKLDAFWIDAGYASRPQFNPFTDSTEYIPHLQGPGCWDLTYEVLSDNVPGSKITLRLEVMPGQVRFGGITLGLSSLAASAGAAGTSGPGQSFST